MKAKLEAVRVDGTVMQRFLENEMQDQMTHAEAVSKIAEMHEECEAMRSAMQKAAEQIRRCDYTPARSTLLVALAKVHNTK